MIDQDLYEIIDSYLKGELTAEAKENFEKRLNTDDELKKELSLQKDLYDFAALDMIHKVIIKSETRYFSKKSLNKRLISYGVAATIVFCIGYFTFFSRQNSDLPYLYAEYANWNDLPSLTERIDTENTLYKAENAFNKADYNKSIVLFTSYLDSIPNNPQVLVYLGISYLESEKDSLALETFSKLINSGTLDAHRGYWYKAIIYLKNNDKTNAIKMLKKVSESTTNFKFEEAQQILEYLD